MFAIVKKFFQRIFCSSKNHSKFYDTICPNCDKSLHVKITDVFFVCPYCECKYVPTWRELGIDADEMSKRRTIISNPNPMKFWKQKEDMPPPLEDGISLNDEIKDTDYKGGLKSNLEWIRKGEENLFLYGACPAPRPFTNLAILARKTKNYELEIAVCYRARELVKIHDEYINEQDEKNCIRFSQTQIYKVIERLPRALELLKKEKGGDEVRLKKNMKLEKQCSQYSIKLEYIKMVYDRTSKRYMLDAKEDYKRPEDAVLALMRKDGWTGTAYELRGLLLAMQAACMDYVEKMSKNIFMEDFVGRAFNVQIYLYNLDKNKVLNDIKAATNKQIVDNFDFLMQSEENRRYYPTLTTDDMEVVLYGLGRKRFHKLAEMVLENPEDNANGWPDIFAFNGQEMQLIEVKTTDHLLDSQIYTWTQLLPKLGLNSKVVCIQKLKSDMMV